MDSEEIIRRIEGRWTPVDDALERARKELKKLKEGRLTIERVWHRDGDHIWCETIRTTK